MVYLFDYVYKNYIMIELFMPRWFADNFLFIGRTPLSRDLSHIQHRRCERSEVTQRRPNLKTIQK